MTKRANESGTFHIATGARLAPPRDHRIAWDDDSAVDTDTVVGGPDGLKLRGPCDVGLLPSVNQRRSAPRDPQAST